MRRRCAAIERRIIEVPFWRSELPNEPVEIMTVFFVACAAAFRRKIKLAPLEFGLWRRRRLIGFRVADQIAAHGDERLAAFGPKRRHDVGCPRPPIKTADDRLSYLHRWHQAEPDRSQLPGARAVSDPS